MFQKEVKSDLVREMVAIFKQNSDPICNDVTALVPHYTVRRVGVLARTQTR